jgi:tetratricopeptide (TPR) repeat protein
MSLDSAFDRGDFIASARHWRGALELAEASGSTSPRDFAAILNSLGMACKFCGKYDEAERAYHRALGLMESVVEPGDIECAALYHNLGGLEHARGCCAAGEVWARKGLAIRLAAQGPDHVDTAADMAALAAILDGQRRFEESEALHLHAVAVFERQFGPEHIETGMALANLAALRSAQGRISEATELSMRALAIKRHHLGEFHPSVGWSWNNLAVLERTRGNATEAETFFARALAILEPRLGSDHRHVVTCRANYEALRDSRAARC